MKISVSIFTNSTLSAPKTDIIRRTYDSFCDTFGSEYPVTVYCDENPKVGMANNYMINLVKAGFENLIRTKSLSEGYIHAVKNTDSDFCFMLEHDWQFNKHLIKHSLIDIVEYMAICGIYHLRFNKRQNVVSGWDIGLTEKNTDENKFKYCETSVLSNNPHIIDVKKYREKCFPLIEIKPGSKGIEENLTHVGLTGAIYGPREYPATIIHQDGRRKH
jgi:hypothetical protein